MKDTLPPNLRSWSGPAAPDCCLANRSPARKSSERLQRNLETALKSRLSGHGSMIYSTAWKPHVTPLGRAICRLRASALRTSASAPTSEPSALNGWPTPTAANGTGAGTRGRDGGMNLQTEATLSGWPTASARDWKDTAGMSTTGVNPDGSERTRLDQLPRVAVLSGWPTPNTMTGGQSSRGGDRIGEALKLGAAQLCGWGTASIRWRTPSTADDNLSRIATEAMEAMEREWGRPNGSHSNLAKQTAVLSGWPTPMAGTPAQNGYNEVGNNDSSRKTVDLCKWTTEDGPARLTTRGELLIGCSAGMPSGGQLRPAHSRWLMGFPSIWDTAAILVAMRQASLKKKSASRSAKSNTPAQRASGDTATRSTRGSRRSSSLRSLTLYEVALMNCLDNHL